jgi:protein-tyrosine phosphatase
MIDTHCHLLPGLDDGTRSLSEAAALAGELRDAGVTTVLCTPHLSRRFPTDLAVARERLAALASELAAAEIALELHLAAELSPNFAVSLDAGALEGVTIGGRYVLVELEPATPASAVETIFEHLQGRSLRPVFAHPERCRSVAQDPRTLVAAREAGALVQVVATSVAGSWGRGVERAALGLLDAGRVDLLGSDSHRPGRAGRRVLDVLQLLARRWGDDVVHQLTVEGPRDVLGA